MTIAGRKSSAIEPVQNGALTSSSRVVVRPLLTTAVVVGDHAQAEQLLAERLPGVLALAQHERDRDGGERERHADEPPQRRGEVLRQAASENGIATKTAATQPSDVSTTNAPKRRPRVPSSSGLNGCGRGRALGVGDALAPDAPQVREPADRHDEAQTQATAISRIVVFSESISKPRASRSRLAIASEIPSSSGRNISVAWAIRSNGISRGGGTSSASNASRSSR